MRRIVIAAAMSLFVVSLAIVASADTLVMRDGSRVEGTLVSFAGRTITFRHADGTAYGGTPSPMSVDARAKAFRALTQMGFREHITPTRRVRDPATSRRRRSSRTRWARRSA